MTWTDLSSLSTALTSLSHPATMFALGMWGALALRPQEPRQVRQRLWQAPLTVVGVMLAGVAAARLGLPFPGVGWMIAASLLALGLLIALSRGLAVVSMVTLVALYAFFRGMAFGAAGQASGTATLGLMLVTAGLHVAGLALGHRLRQQFMRRQQLMQRAVGTGVAALGVYTLLHAW